MTHARNQIYVYLSLCISFYYKKEVNTITRNKMILSLLLFFYKCVFFFLFVKKKTFFSMFVFFFLKSLSNTKNHHQNNFFFRCVFCPSFFRFIYFGAPSSLCIFILVCFAFSMSIRKKMNTITISLASHSSLPFKCARNKHNFSSFLFHHCHMQKNVKSS
jgi:hypothetical protein